MNTRKTPLDREKAKRRDHCCSCLINRARTVNLKVYLVFVILLSVVLVIFMTTRLSHKSNGFQVQDYAMLNDSSQTDHQPVLNMTETKEPGLLLILIHASGKDVGKERRDAIRATWISDIDLISDELGQEISYRFVLGGLDVPANVMDNLTKEARQYQDMIFLDKVPDTHASLTQRTLQGFEYIVNNSLDYKYVLKCDDDTFVNVKTISRELKDMNGEGRIYWGEFLGACNVLTDGPYAEWEWRQCETYVPYAYGGGYIVSQDLVELIAINAPHLKQYKNEDVSVGAWLAPYSVSYRHDARFNTGSNSRGCKRQFVVSHKIPAQSMYKYYASLSRDGYFCSRRNRWYGWRGHTYNWKTVPSKCCRQSRRIP